MSLRIRFARFLLNLGSFIQSLPIVVMRPDDLVEFSRQSYARDHDVEGWAEDGLVNSGLWPYELDLLSFVPEKKGELLLLGLGGGREAIPMACMGFRVTGVDYVPAMIDRSKQNANRRGVSIEGFVQEISQLDVRPETYDVVWLSRAMYSCVPTRARRVEMVRRITRALKPGGFFLCQFHWDTRWKISRKGRLLHRLIALCTMGNLAYEEGDMLWGNIEFLHAFKSEEEVRSELEEGGLSVKCISVDQSSIRGEAVCVKNPATES